MIFQLPTRSPRKYRGKYPTRINSWSYSRSPSQMAIADFLGIGRPVHLELNDGRRFIADMKSLNPDGVKLNTELYDIWAEAETVKVPHLLSQERYDAMLVLVREARA